MFERRGTFCLSHIFGSQFLIRFMNTPIKISDGPLSFDREAWIGKGIKISSNPFELDQSLVEYCDTLLEIPSSVFQHSFPSEKTRVKEFVTYTLPKPTSSLALIKPARCFHPHKPNDDGSQLGPRILFRPPGCDRSRIC